MPKIYNKNKGKVPRDAVYVGRGSKYGNPFEIGKHGTRDEVCDLFEEKILPKINVSELRGKDLVCFCAPARCHAESLMKKANVTCK